MALKVGELYGELSLNSGPFVSGLAQAEGQTAASGLKMGAVMGIAMQAVQMAMTQIVGFLTSAREAFLQEETSIANLGQMLMNNVPAWDGNTEAIEKYVAAQIDLGFQDEEVRDSLGKLVGVTHDVAGAMDLSSLAADLARAKHLTLAVATKDVTLASEGVGRALKGLGVDIVGLTGGAALLDAIQKNVAGSAAELAATDEGKLAAANARLHQDMEKIGALLTQITVAVLPPLVGAFTVVANIIAFVSQNAGLLTPVLAAVAVIIMAAVVPALLSMAAAAIAAAMATIEVWGPTVALITVLVAVAAGIVNFADKLGVLKPILAAVGFVAQALAWDIQAIVGSVERIISVLTHLDGSADESAQHLDGASQSVTDMGIAMDDTSAAAGDLASTTSTSMSTAASSTWAASTGVVGALKTIIAGYDATGDAIMMTIPDFLAFQDASRAAADAAVHDDSRIIASAQQKSDALAMANSYMGVPGSVGGAAIASGDWRGMAQAGISTYGAGGVVPGSGPRLIVAHGGEEIRTPAQRADDGATRASGARSSVQLTVNNPKPEPASTSISRELQKLAAMGFLEPAGAAA